MLNAYTTGPEFCQEERKFFKGREKDKTIVTLGGSYMYGHGLPRNKTFPYILSELTGYSVYNYSECGGCLSGSISIIKDDADNLNKIKNTKYVIYIYMYDHVNRTVSAERAAELYKEKYTKHSKILSFFDNFYVTKTILNKTRMYKINHSFPNAKLASIILKDVLTKDIKTIREFMPITKIIFILYDEKRMKEWGIKNIRYEHDIMNSDIWKELQQEQKNVQIIHTKDLTGFYFDKNYKLMKDFAPFHPNEKAWELFTPLFVNNYITK